MVVSVRFSYDLNGLLEVEATLLERPEVVVSKIFERGSESLAPADMQRARERLARLKADPAQRPLYRDLIGRADGLWSELGGSEREQLSRASQRFDDALAGRNPADIHAAYTNLLQVCEQFDQGERW